MTRKFALFLSVIFVFFILSSTAHATSDYVLPYPSAMPGSFIYKPRLIFEAISKYWYFGNFGQFSYNLKESDKYLVEAKTLFEYKQYLLGYKALQKSDAYFKKTLPNLDDAKRERKDIGVNRMILSSASQKHIEILKILAGQVPQIFNWQPEKSSASVLNLKSLIDNSVLIRQKYL